MPSLTIPNATKELADRLRAVARGKRHELKTWPGPFRLVWRGLKRYEVRVNDRGFQPGDTLLLREWLPRRKRYTKKAMLAVVTVMTPGGRWGLPKNISVLGIEVLAWMPNLKRSLKFGGPYAR